MNRIKLHLDDNQTIKFNRGSSSSNNHICNHIRSNKTNKLNMRDPYNFHLKKLRVKWAKKNDVLMIFIGAAAAIVGFLIGRYI